MSDEELVMVDEEKSWFDGEVDADRAALDEYLEKLMGVLVLVIVDEVEERDEDGDVDVAGGLDEPHIEQMVVLSVCLLKQTIHVHLVTKAGC